jgi:L-ascorbate metabolism protein UlaG (beta-lactamase superfamily)
MRGVGLLLSLTIAAAWLALAPPAIARQQGGAAPAPAPAPAPAGKIAHLELATSAPAAAGDAGSVQFIGTATVLLRYGGLTILTDPNFLHKGDHVHLGYGLQAQRLTNPAIEFNQLPPIDLVILSHLHEDHFDKLVQQKLRRDMPIVTTPEAGARLARLGFTRTIALSRWDGVEVVKGSDRLRVSAMPGRHGGPVSARLLPPVMGSMLEFGSGAAAPGYRMYISGDTLLYDDIAEIPRRYPNIDLALLHLGGTRILGVVKVTMDGKDGVRMLQLIAPQRAIPIHYNDYDVFKSPLSEFQRAVANAGLTDKVTYLKHGDTYRFVPPRP